jgi:C4-dicarboxylate-binding protein DctP
MMSAASGHSWQLYAVSSVVTRTDHAAITFTAIINEKTWQSLDARHKTILGDAAKLVERLAREREAELQDQAYEFLRSKGMTIRDLSPEEVMQWRACSANVIDEYMEQGGDLSRLLMDAYGRLRTEPCCVGGPPLR